MSQSKRLTQIGNIRALAIFLVVLGHSIILYSSSWDLYSTTVVPVLDTLKKLINLIQMPLFFSLSGYLFVFTHRKRRGFLNLLKNKAVRLLIPYIGIGLLFMLPLRLLVRYEGYQELSFRMLLEVFMTCSDVGHLWFLPALFLMFLLSEILLDIAERVPGFKHYPEVFLCLGAAALYLEGYRISFGYPPLQSAYGNLLWFAVGYFLCAQKDILNKIYSKHIIKWMLVIADFELLLYQVFVAPLGLLLSLGSVGLCIANVYGIMPQKSCAVIGKIDANSFGIYLFHSPLIYITFANIPNANPVIVVFINLVIFGAAAYFLTELVRKSKLKVLIGE